MEEKLLHPNLLTHSELITLIKERQLNIDNIEELPRNELIEIFKRHIMPKPQRRTKNDMKRNISTSSTETVQLAQEVKKIKLNRVNNQMPQPMDCSPVSSSNSNGQKRNITDNSNQNFNKRQRIQWP